MNVNKNKMDETDTPVLVPFGKYKGQPISILLNDTEYLIWCKQQPWFQKFPMIYNIANRTIRYENETPLQLKRESQSQSQKPKNLDNMKKKTIKDYFGKKSIAITK
jgi:hypothetical protein